LNIEQVYATVQESQPDYLQTYKVAAFHADLMAVKATGITAYLLSTRPDGCLVRSMAVMEDNLPGSQLAFWAASNNTILPTSFLSR
jgi:hypothetical protein